MIEDCYMTGIIDKINSLYPISDDTIRTLKEEHDFVPFSQEVSVDKGGHVL